MATVEITAEAQRQFFDLPVDRVQFRVARGGAIEVVIVEKVGHRDGLYED